MKSLMFNCIFSNSVYIGERNNDKYLILAAALLNWVMSNCHVVCLFFVKSNVSEKSFEFDDGVEFL